MAQAPKGAACTACRAKKRRCDGDKPSCYRCTQNGDKCTYHPLKLNPKTAILQKAVEDLEAKISSIEKTRHVPKSNLPYTTGPTVAPILAVESAGTFLTLSSRNSSAIKIKLSSCGIPRLLGSWWESGDYPPSGLSDFLADTFLRYETQYTYDPKPREFFLALQAPDTGTGPNSALRNIIFLIGCNFLGGPWAALEPVFLKRTRQGMENSLAKLDRLIDFIEASMLLSGYQFLKGRFVDAFNTNSAAMLFAAACGLNALTPPFWGGDATQPILPPPKTEDDLKHRVNIWWTLFRMNRAGCSATLLPAALPDEKITTVWEVTSFSS
ncbi:hypothetical protein BOTBODRAFT_62073, partial [Botryobasidium botryosum FD-172 SS1]